MNSINDNYFTGLLSVYLTKYPNISCYANKSIKFTLEVIFEFNETVPIGQNQSNKIMNIQQTSLSKQCNYNITVKIKSILLPFEKIVTVTLVTGGKKKRSADPDPSCMNDINVFNNTCSTLNDLTQCDKTGIYNFLNNFTTQSLVIFLIKKV